jgi:hypothetical protein
MLVLTLTLTLLESLEVVKVLFHVVAAQKQKRLTLLISRCEHQDTSKVSIGGADESHGENIDDGTACFHDLNLDSPPTGRKFPTPPERSSMGVVESELLQGLEIFVDTATAAATFLAIEATKQGRCTGGLCQWLTTLIHISQLPRASALFFSTISTTTSRGPKKKEFRLGCSPLQQRFRPCCPCCRQGCRRILPRHRCSFNLIRMLGT